MKLRITRLGAESATTASAIIEKSRLRRAIAAASGVDCKRYRIPLQRWSRKQLNQAALCDLGNS
jgi:hypothetical protein